LLAHLHYFPGTADRLFPLLRKLLRLVLHYPCIAELPAITFTTLAHGLHAGVVIRSDSPQPDVSAPPPPILPLSIPRPAALTPDLLAVPSTMPADPGSAPAPIPHPTSLLCVVLTLADFPEPTPALASSVPVLTILRPRPITLGLSPPSAPPSPRCELPLFADNLALQGAPVPSGITPYSTGPVHGYHALRSTGGSFSVQSSPPFWLRTITAPTPSLCSGNAPKVISSCMPGS